MDDPSARLSIVTGSMGSGKTEFVRHFIYRRVMMGLVAAVYVFSGADNDDYDFIPYSTFYNRFDEGILSQIYNSQRRYIKDGVHHKPPPIMIVFDDIFPEVARERTRKKKSNDPEDFHSFQHMIKTLRHKNIYVLGVSQEIGGIPPYFREMVTGFSAHFLMADPRVAKGVSHCFPVLSGKDGIECLKYFRDRLKEKYYCLIYNYPTMKVHRVKIKPLVIPKILQWNPIVFR